MKEKPAPVEEIFHDCPPEGDGGDLELNRLKNRIDDAKEYSPVAFDVIESLPWPRAVERRKRRSWNTEDADEINRYEGIPVVAEGYVASVKEEGGESPNCHADDPAFRDFHIWLVKYPGDDRSNAIVVEATPRVREKHPAWTLAAFRSLTKRNLPVRISGWLLLDPEHPDQVGKTRGTIWEIHPITRVEVKDRLEWIRLDDADIFASD